jgi:hypothetical protein
MRHEKAKLEIIDAVPAEQQKQSSRQQSRAQPKAAMVETGIPFQCLRHILANSLGSKLSATRTQTKMFQFPG